MNGKRGVPGWNEFVKPYKDKSIFWNDVWKNAGSPGLAGRNIIGQSSKSKEMQMKSLRKNSFYFEQ